MAGPVGQYLQADPGETRNLAGVAEQVQLLERLRGELDRQKKAVGYEPEPRRAR